LPKTQYELRKIEVLLIYPKAINSQKKKELVQKKLKERDT